MALLSLKKFAYLESGWTFKLGPHYGSSRLRENWSHNAHDPKISKENGDNICVYPKANLTLWIIFIHEENAMLEAKEDNISDQMMSL
ncbi:hypothetical protein YC2023_012934 [Brassica napus]